MKRVLVLMMLLTLATCEWMPLYAANTRHEWTLTYFQSDCERQCLPWFPADADSAKIHHLLKLSGADTLLYVADTAIFYRGQ